jgi:type II secretory pathway pseudopilin PulG
MTSRAGLTRIELSIAVVILGVAASVAVPAAVNRRIMANEASAMAALRDIATAQERFQAAKYVDVNGNGVGEYGFLRELTGAVGVRTDAIAATVRSPVDPPLLPREFRRVTSNSEVARSGYLFKMYLPGAAGIGVPEMSSGNLAATIDSQLAATTWCCYARPQRHGVTGGRTFFINQTGDIVETDARSGGRFGFVASNAGSAFVQGGSLWTITGAVAVGTVGRDGYFWRRATPHAETQDLVSRGTLHDSSSYYVPRPSGSFEIAVHDGPSGNRETLVVHAFHLRPGSRYVISVRAPSLTKDWFAARVTADADGRASFRFDSGRGAFPAGLASLTELVGGGVVVEPFYDGVLSGAYGTIPRFGVRAAAMPVAERIDADEASTIAALREIAVAQEQFKAMDATHWDGYGIAEYGLLRELTGQTGVRTTSNASTVGDRIDPPLLPSPFAPYTSNGEAVRSGYLLHLFLPGSAGAGVAEVSDGSLAQAIDLTLAATTWCCYASPQRYGRTGKRTFFINQTGDIVATDQFPYSGTGQFISSNAGSAFRYGGYLPDITGVVATGTVGRDFNLWRAVADRPDEHDFVVRDAMTSSGAAAGTFAVESNQLQTRTDETIDVDATGLDASKDYVVVLTNASQVASMFGTATSDARGGVSFRFDGRIHSLPDGVASVADFGGGTIELRDGDTPVLSGTIPVFATVLGPPIAGSSVVFHVKRPLDEIPKSLPRCGTFDVRVTNAPDGRRGQFVVDITTFDRGATYDVVAVDGQNVETALGAITVRGWNGVGALSLDVDADAVVALSGARIEVRASTGAVVLAGTMPVVR